MVRTITQENGKSGFSKVVEPVVSNHNTFNHRSGTSVMACVSDCEVLPQALQCSKQVSAHAEGLSCKSSYLSKAAVALPSTHRIFTKCPNSSTLSAG